MHTRNAMMTYGAILGLVLTSPASAQQQCKAEEMPVAYLGINGIGGFTMRTRANLPTDYEFWSEPQIRGIEPGSPGYGKLKSGDFIIAIDGQLITTAEGGRRYTQMQPWVPVELTVRRGDRVLGVEVTPGAHCQPVEDAQAAVELQPRFAPRPLEYRVRTGRVTPSGWLGFSIGCSDCTINTRPGRRGFVFAQPPVIDRVEPGGPADETGLRSGDLLVSIGGHPFTSEEGGRFFSALQPEQVVDLEVERNGRTFSARVVAGTRPSSPGPRTGASDRGEEVTRFSGLVGDALVEVTGGPVNVTRTADELIIRGNDITVRIRRTGAERH